MSTFSSSRPSSATTVSNEKKDAQQAPAQEYFVLLVDHWLQELPLEALAALQNEVIVSVSREVSLQMLHHKWSMEILGKITVETLLSDLAILKCFLSLKKLFLISDEAAEKAKKEKEKNKPMSRIPGMKDASKKQSKIVRLSVTTYFNSEHISLSTKFFGLLVDSTRPTSTPRLFGC